MLGNIQTSDEFLQKDFAQVLMSGITTLDSSRKEVWNAWIYKYITRLREENNTDDLLRKERMNKVNPRYILRNYYLFKAVQLAETGNFDEVENLLQVISNPYEERPELSIYSEEPPEWANVVGVCVNSCSS
ncbi:UPF0061 protein A [Galdieria sulphuraria]|nr:UPF0061 protein A [Galdieria sulphuraria]